MSRFETGSGSGSFERKEARSPVVRIALLGLILGVMARSSSSPPQDPMPLGEEAGAARSE